MKKVIIIHGWGGNPNSEAWFSWIKKELSKRQILLNIPKMPNTNNPEIKTWTNKIKEVAKNINENTYFIGHSIGCQAILRYFEQEKSLHVKGAILIAPWMYLDKKTIEEEGEESIRIAKPWVETPINWDKIKNTTKNFVCVFSDNDNFVPLSNAKLFKEKLNAKIIIKHNEEHFNDTKQIKEILEFLK